MDDDQAADLREALVTPVQELIAELVDGAQEDLQRFAARISSDLTAAAAVGDDAGVAEVRAQARALAEAHRLRAVRGQWDALEAVVGNLARITIAAAATAR